MFFIVFARERRDAAVAMMPGKGRGLPPDEKTAAGRIPKRVCRAAPNRPKSPRTGVFFGEKAIFSAFLLAFLRVLQYNTCRNARVSRFFSVARAVRT